MEAKDLEVGGRRRCDNCGRPYTIVTATHRFCKTGCRAEFHRHGTPLVRLRPELHAIEQRIFAALPPESKDEYRRLYPNRAAEFDAELNKQLKAAGGSR